MQSTIKSILHTSTSHIPCHNSNTSTLATCNRAQPTDLLWMSSEHLTQSCHIENFMVFNARRQASCWVFLVVCFGREGFPTPCNVHCKPKLTSQLESTAEYTPTRASFISEPVTELANKAITAPSKPVTLHKAACKQLDCQTCAVWSCQPPAQIRQTAQNRRCSSAAFFCGNSFFFSFFIFFGLQGRCPSSNGKAPTETPN